MTVFQISYDLQDPGQDYDELFEAIKSYSGYCHILESTWFISTGSTSSAGNVRDELEDYVDANDELLVTKMPSSGGGRWGTTFSGDSTDWLHEEL